MTSSEGRLALHPVDLSDPTADVLVYDGPCRLELDDLSVTGRASAQFRWLPSPEIVASIGHDDLSLAFRYDECPSCELSGPWPSAMLQCDGPSAPEEARATFDRTLHGELLGQDRPADAIVAYLLNFTAGIDPWQRSVSIESNDLVVELRPVDAIGASLGHIKATGLYAATHVVSVRRADGHPITADEFDSMSSFLFHATSFAEGRLVGLALPSGVDSHGDPLWLRPSVTSVERATNALSWCDTHHYVDQFTGFAAALARVWEDTERRRDIIRAIRTGIAANHASPVDLAVPAAQVGLEIIESIVLTREGWLDTEHKLDAAGRIRLLLKWAGIPTAIPDDYHELRRFSSAYGGSQFTDGPKALTQVRNALVHPPKGKRDWPTADLMTEAWRLGCWYLELVILRMAGYTGEYADRRDLEGRWTGDVTPVPWAEPPVQGEA